MNIYLISRRTVVYYDEFSAFVVSANTEEQARSMCPHADEGRIWVNPDLVDCRLVGTTLNQNPEIILTDFKAG